MQSLERGGCLESHCPGDAAEFFEAAAFQKRFAVLHGDLELGRRSWGLGVLRGRDRAAREALWKGLVWGGVVMGRPWRFTVWSSNAVATLE